MCNDSMIDISHALPNSIRLSVFSTFDTWDASNNFHKHFSVSCEDFVLHGQD